MWRRYSAPHRKACAGNGFFNLQMITQNCKQIPCLCSPLPHNLSRSVYVYTLPSYRVKLWLQVSTWSVFVTVLCFALFIVSLLKSRRYLAKTSDWTRLHRSSVYSPTSERHCRITGCTSCTRMHCQKCNLYLCPSSGKQCFY